MIRVQQLEANIVRHCNNRCVACSHASAFQPAWTMTPEMLLRDLIALSPCIHANQFKLLGGEPTLHPDICEMLAVSHAAGIADEINVTTNGRLLPKMPPEFWERTDHLFLSVYPNLDESIVEFTREHCRRHNIKLEVARWTEFFLQFKAVPDDGVESFRTCQWKSCCYTVHDGNFYLCPQSAFFTDRFMNLPQSIDGLPLDSQLTEERLRDYMNRQTPFRACTVCSPQSNQVKWFQPKTLEEWVRSSTHQDRVAETKGII